MPRKPLLLLASSILIIVVAAAITLRPQPAHSQVWEEVAVAGVAIGSLEALQLAVIAAASVGIITITQQEEFQRQLQGLVSDIKTSSQDLLQEAVQTAQKIGHQIEARIRTCGHCPWIIPASKPDTQTGAQTKSRTQAEPCPSPKNCCKGKKPSDANDPTNFWNKFKKLLNRPETKNYSHSNGFRLWASGRAAPDCCLEWDSMHSQWEVYKNRVHQGSRSCDDDNSDPCAASDPKKYGPHVQPDPAGHAPRLCGK